ncbi:cytochrome P450 [Mucilaginibacter sp.]
MSSKYNFPDGNTTLQSLLGSFKLVKDPISYLSGEMEKFSGTYSGFMPDKGRVIVTQNSDLINYVLRENHTNYKKAKLDTDLVAKQLGTSLLFVNGDDWRRQRRLIQPAFHHAGINQLYETVMKTVNGYIDNLPLGEQVDVYPLMRELSFSVLINSLFNIDMSATMKDELGRAFVGLQAFMSKDVLQPFRRILYPLTGEEKKLVKQWDAIRDMLREIIALRRADETEHNDLLAMLMNARYEDTGQGMSEHQLISELLILLFAGHETTGSTLSWLLYLTASNHQVYEKLMGTIGETDMHNAPRNSYINAIINEGMRLYPSVWINERVAINDDEFSGFTFPAGTSILTYIYGMHRSEGYWENASAFDPERFLNSEGVIDKNIKNYFPFGAGPRMCVGNNFAMAEMAFVLHAVCKKFHINTTGATPKAWPLLTLRPSEVILGIKKK